MGTACDVTTTRRASSVLIVRLLMHHQVNPEKRLGCGKGGVNEIKQHRFFARINWDDLEKRKLPAPMKPKIRNPLDTSNFDNFDSSDVEPPPMPPGRAEKQPDWSMWEWIEEDGKRGA